MVYRTPFISASSALFLVVALTMLGGAYYPDYNHLSQFISELGARQAPHEQVVRWVGFLPAGVLVLVFVIVAFKALPRSVLSTFGLLGIAAYAFGYVAAAFYPCDFGCRPTEPSRSQVIHNIAGLTGYLLAPLSLAALSRSARHWPNGRGLAAAGLIAATLALLGLVSLSPESPYVGLSQRLLELSVLVWNVMCGWYIMTRLPNAASSAAELGR
jgi:hypothetical protein